ncbi:unnamed protein product, partial [Effrenium voratum]
MSEFAQVIHYGEMARRGFVQEPGRGREMSGQATLLKPQEISNTLWAYGKQKIAHEELFKALGWSAFELVWQCRFKPQ